MGKYSGTDIQDMTLFSIEQDDSVLNLVEKLNHNFDQILRHERTDLVDFMTTLILRNIADGKYSKILGAEGSRIKMIGKPGRDGSDGRDGNTVVQASQSVKFLQMNTSDLREIQYNSYSISIPNTPEKENERIELLKYRVGDVIFTKNGDLLTVESVTDSEIFVTRKINYSSISGGGGGGTSPGTGGGGSGSTGGGGSAFHINTDIENSTVRDHILQTADRILLGQFIPSSGESNNSTRYYRFGLGIGKHAYGDPTLAIANIPQTLTADANAVDSDIKDQLRLYFRKNSQQSFDFVSPRHWASARYVDLYENDKSKGLVTGQRLRLSLENSDGEDTNQPFIELLTNKRTSDSHSTISTHTLSVIDRHNKRAVVIDNRQRFVIKSMIADFSKSILYTNERNDVLATEYEAFSAPSIKTNTISPNSGTMVSIGSGNGLSADVLKTKKLQGASGAMSLSDNTVLTVDAGSDIRIGDTYIRQWISDTNSKVGELDRKSIKSNTLFSDIFVDVREQKLNLRTLGFGLFSPSDGKNMTISTNTLTKTGEGTSSNIYVSTFIKGDAGVFHNKYSPIHRLFGVFAIGDTDVLADTHYDTSESDKNTLIGMGAWGHGKFASSQSVSVELVKSKKIADYEDYVKIPAFNLSGGSIDYSTITFPSQTKDEGWKRAGNVIVMKPSTNLVSQSEKYVFESEKKVKTYYVKLHNEIYDDTRDKFKPVGFKVQDGWSCFEYDINDVSTYQKMIFDKVRVDVSDQTKNHIAGNRRNPGVPYGEGNIFSTIINYDAEGRPIKRKPGGNSTNNFMLNATSFMAFIGHFQMRNLGSGHIEYEDIKPAVYQDFVSEVQRNFYYMNAMDLIAEGMNSNANANPITLEKFQRVLMNGGSKCETFDSYVESKLNRKARKTAFVFSPIKTRSIVKLSPFSDRSLNHVPCVMTTFMKDHSVTDESQELLSNDMFSIKVVGDVVHMDIYVECSLLQAKKPQLDSFYAYQRHVYSSDAYEPGTDSSTSLKTILSNTRLTDCLTEQLNSMGNWGNHSLSYSEGHNAVYKKLYTNNIRQGGNNQNPLQESYGFSMSMLIPSVFMPVTDIMFSDNTTLYTDGMCKVSMTPFRAERDLITGSFLKDTIPNRRAKINSNRPYNNVAFDDRLLEFSGYTSLYKKGVGYTQDYSADCGFAPNKQSYTSIVVEFNNPNQIDKYSLTSNLVEPQSGVKFKKISLTWVKPGISEMLERMQMSDRTRTGGFSLDNDINVETQKIYGDEMFKQMKKYLDNE